VIARGRRALAAGAIALAVLGCSPLPASPTSVTGSTAPSSPAAVPSPVGRGGACGRVTLAVNPWLGSEADVAVVGYLLEHELGCAVVRRRLDDESSWQFLASRGIDAILENWDHEDLAAKYITTERVAEDAGPNGTEGIIGWFVPRFFAEANPEVLTAKTNPSILNAYADQFRTPESGQMGQLLDGDPGFVTEDRAMIRGFGLNFQVVYSGSEEASDAAIRAAIADHRPILAYFVRPNWFSTTADLVRVELPAFTPGCNKDPNLVACDYPVYQLNKVVSTKFASSGSPAYDLIRRFRWSNADQELVAAAIVDGLTADEAAKQWLDANPATWRTWLP
jgi:glycine betaine/proline transport system substrate-binding protein